jgi:Ser-tRNA(Ala) deacylase AlaX
VHVLTLHTVVHMLLAVCYYYCVHTLQVRNAMGEDAKETLVAVTTDEQREELITLANNLEEWLYDDG